MLDKLQRLVDAGIELVPAVEITTHFIFQRDGFAALVERRGDGFGGIGSSGLLTTEAGLAMLVWRGEQAHFVGRGYDRPATDEEVQKLRAFSADLTAALTS
ncbi:hypothetical protein F183_A27530 [Bryobacterales bacterium F-183]|nr:hypothetical protein F183_A27530 [Bryobacterales bacterium F-183]